MAEKVSQSIAIVVCSTRKPRACPQIAEFVLTTLKSSSLFSPSSHTFEIIDLATWNLPLFDGPEVPSQVKSAAGYSQPHAQRWSAEVSRHAAFIFVTPQYNWGYPAAAKNAIDYLFHEWSGKPAMIVSYGGHGGGKAARQLREVLQGVRMNPVETIPQLQFSGREMLGVAATGGDLKLTQAQEAGGKAVWDDYRGTVETAFKELVSSLSASAP